MKLKLVIPSVKYKDTFCAYVKDYIDANENFYAKFYHDALVDFNEYVKKLITFQTVVTNSKSEPYNSFWFIDSRDKIVGISRLRKGLNEWTKKSIGHIGFDVRPSERRKGYANQILNLTLKEAKIRGHKKLLIITDTDNIATKKVIETNGGKLIDEITSLLTNNQAFRFEISL